MMVDVPASDDELETVVRLLDAATQLRAEQERFVESVKSLKDGVFQLLPPPVE
jgi:hypothetical protein